MTKKNNTIITKHSSKKSQMILLTIDIVRQSRRLDHAVDYLIKATLVDEEDVFISVRLDGENALACYWLNEMDNSDERKLCWASVIKKRTLKATCRLFLSTHPDTFNQHSTAFYELNRDDMEARDALLLSKRAWRVHEVALYGNGYFIARLSCTTVKNRVTTDNQFVLHYAGFSTIPYPKEGELWPVNTRHGFLSSSVNVSAQPVYHALRDEYSWPLLSDALKTVEYGYKTEREAKAGFALIVQRKKNKTPRVITYRVRNAVRQHAIDKSLNVAVCDMYQSVREDAWLLKFNDGYFIARMDASVAGKITLSNLFISTAFTNIEESSVDLISQYQQSGLTTGAATAQEARQQWKAMIEADLRQRYFIQNLTATWLILDVAIDANRCMAIRALCLPASSLDLPFEFQAHTYHILYVDTHSSKLVDPSPLSRQHSTFNHSAEHFNQEVSRLVETAGATQPKAIEDMLRYSRGFTCKEDADAVWSKVSIDWDVQPIDGLACPISPSSRRKQFEYNMATKRLEISKRSALGHLEENSVNVFNARIELAMQFPKALVELGVSYGLCSQEISLSIPTRINKYRYDLTVDLFGEKPSDELNTTKKEHSPQEVINSSVCPSLPEEIKTTQKSNAGRKRIHENEAEKKRVWARKNRISKRKELLELGLQPNKPGRKKQFNTPAEKQAAYRFREKWKTISLDSVLIFVGASQDYHGEAGLVSEITALLPFFCEGDQQRIIVALPDNNPMEKSNVNTIITKQTSTDNVYIISSHNDYGKLMVKLNALSVTNVVLCGFSITDVCYRIACYLDENGYTPSVIKRYLVTDGAWERKEGLNLFRKKFGNRSLL